MWPLSHRGPREADPDVHTAEAELQERGQELQVPTPPWLATVLGGFLGFFFNICTEHDLNVTDC